MHSADRTSGGRRCPRPARVEPCETCGAPTGSNYLSCAKCREAVDRIWLADWRALLESTGIAPDALDDCDLARTILLHQENYSWTVVDIAMSKVSCGSCGSELGGGPKDCPECEMAFGNLWVTDVEGQRTGAMTGNEHSLRVGRWVLRYPHRQSEKAVESWQFSMPILLRGELATTEQAQAIRAALNSGRHLPQGCFQNFYEACEALHSKD